jgi:hypothetical protein
MCYKLIKKENVLTNQRPAKLINRNNNNGDISIKKLIEFSEKAEKLLIENDQEDAAFYFSQLHDWLKQNPHIGLEEECHKILGL